MDDVTATEVRDWMTKRAMKRAKATVNREIGYLRRVCRRAIEQGMATSDPTAGVKKLAGREKTPRFLLPAEVPKLQEHLTGRDWLTVELAYRTGLRRSEQFGLRKLDVSLELGQIILPDPKSGREEIVRLNQRAAEILRELMRTGSEWVFPATRGNVHMDGMNFVNRVFKPACEKAGIINLRWHDLRHTYASWMAIRGIDLFRIMKRMRHRSIRMTQIYAHLLPEHLEDAMEAEAMDAPALRPTR